MAKKTKTYKMEDFLTSEKEEGGLRFTISLPDGTPTDAWVVLYGMASNTMKRAYREWENLCRKAKSEDEKPDFDTVLARAIKDWCFEVPCNYENCLKFLRGSSTFKKFVDQTLGNDRLYFLHGQPPSSKPETMEETEILK